MQTHEEKDIQTHYPFIVYKIALRCLSIYLSSAKSTKQQTHLVSVRGCVVILLRVKYDVEVVEDEAQSYQVAS